MLLLKDILQDNRWLGSSILKSKQIQGFLNTGFVSNLNKSFNIDLTDGDFINNIQSTITVGFTSYSNAPCVYPSLAGAKPKVETATYKEMTAKIFYALQWFLYSNLEKDLMKMDEPKANIQNHLGTYWTSQYERCMALILANIGNIEKIKIGDGTTDWKPDLVYDALDLRGHHVNGSVYSLFMNATTLKRIKSIEKKNPSVTIFKPSIISDSKEISKLQYVFDGATQINLNDDLKDGFIYVLNKPAFGFSQMKNLSSLMYTKEPMENEGSGAEYIGTKSCFTIHPIGFSFKGVLGTDYEKKTGLTAEELSKEPLYDLVYDVKESPIYSIHIKMD